MDRKPYGARSEESNAALSKMMAMAMLEISPEKLESARCRRGAKATLSRISPNRPQASTAAGKASQMERPAVSTSQRAIRPPKVKMAAWARFRMSSTPKTSV